MTRRLHTSVSLLIMTFSDLGGPEKGRCVVVIVVLSCLGMLSTRLQYLGLVVLQPRGLLVYVFFCCTLVSEVFLSLVQFLSKEISPLAGISNFYGVLDSAVKAVLSLL